MRRSPRQRYPYFPGDHDPFIRPLDSIHPQGGWPHPIVPQVSQRRDYYAKVFDQLAQLNSIIAPLRQGLSDNQTLDLARTQSLSDNELGGGLRQDPKPDSTERADGRFGTSIPGPFKLSDDDPAYRVLSFYEGNSPSDIVPLRPDVDRPPVSPTEHSDSRDITGAHEQRPIDQIAEDIAARVYPSNRDFNTRAGETEPPIHLAQARGRQRPTPLVSPTGRPINLPEWFRWHTWINNLEVLRQIDPGNRMLQNMYGPDWVPSERDLFELHREILHQKALRGDPEFRFQGHHPLVTMQGPWYELPPRGISTLERNLGIMMLPRQEHIGRLGIHPWWERGIQEFTREYPQATRNNVYDHLQEHFFNYGQLRTR